MSSLGQRQDWEHGPAKGDRAEQETVTPRAGGTDFKNHRAIANSDSQNAPNPQNSTP